MPLSPDEIASRGPKLYALGLLLVQSFGPESDGGKKLTKEEIRKVGKAALQLLPALVVDLLD
jgi:hypothetical protein